MMILKRPTLLFFFLIGVLSIQAQDLRRSTIFKEGDRYFNLTQYIQAERYYQAVLDEEPRHLGALFQMGECHRLLFDYESALFYYEKVFKNDGGLLFPLSGFYYAEMLKHSGKYAEALDIFDEFHDKLKSQGQHEDPELRIFYKQAHIEKEGCMLALNENTNAKPDHQFRLIDSDDINSEYMDYAAFGYDENKIVFTSSRPEGRGSLMDYRFGEATADLHRFEFVNGSWKEVKDSDKFGKAINTKWGDGAGSFNEAVTKFYYTNCNDDLDEVCHIYVSNLVGGTWTEPKALGSVINQPNFDSRHPDITPSGDTLFFSSNRPGGQGNYDLWMSINAGGENWSQPINLGDQVNTPFFEFAPYYDADQQVLFFASDGHRGYGGYDVFMAKGASFLNPEVYNPGAPFNSNRDEMSIFVDNNRGFVASNREGGKGKLDIYEFQFEAEKEIITEISTDDAIAGRNSIFSDDYDFDSDNTEAINDIISSFLAARMVDVELVLSDDLAKVYESLSLDDKERIDRIVYARIRELNEKGLQSLRIEDEFYYRDMNSSDKSHMDNLITRYIGESNIGKSVRLGEDDQQFYASLNDDQKETTDRLIATRVKQANAFEFVPTTYESLEAGDKSQVDNIAYKYIEDKANIDNLTISPTQTYYLRQLDADKKAMIMASVKEKLLHLSKDTRFELTNADLTFYQNLSSEYPERVEELKKLAAKMMIADVESLNLTAEDKKIYRYYNATQQSSLNKILAKVINNTVKADLYFAEANLTPAEKQQIVNMSPAQYEDFVAQNKPYLNEPADRERIERFLAVSAKTYDPNRPVFMDVASNLPEEQPIATTSNPTSSSETGDTSTEASGNSGSGSASTVAGSASSVAAILAMSEASTSLSSDDLTFYNQLPPQEKATIQRLITMEKVSKAYENRQLKQTDDAFLESLTAQEKQYVEVLSKRMQGVSLSSQEQSLLNAAQSYYEQQVPTNRKQVWSRLIAREAMLESADGSTYLIPASDSEFVNSLDASEQSNLYNLISNRVANDKDPGSLFTDSYNFDSGDMESIYDVISAFVAARLVDGGLVLTGELAAFYNSLSDADKERIEDIVYARIRQMNERGLQTMRIEDEFYYDDLTSSDKDHMDDLITRFIDGAGVGSIGLDPQSSAFYTSLSGADKERVDRLIAARIKQSTEYQHTPTSYDQLSSSDRQEVDGLVEAYVAGKKSLGNLAITQEQQAYLQGLDQQKRSQVVAAIKDKMLIAAGDPTYKLTDADVALYQQLGTEAVSSLKALAGKMIQFDAEEIELTPQDVQVYSQYSQSEQKSLDRILTKLVDNTVKSDLYFAESKLTSQEKAAIATMSPAQREAFVQQISSRFPDPKDLDRIRRFMEVTAPVYDFSESVFKREKDVPAVQGPTFVFGSNSLVPDLNVATLELVRQLQMGDLAFYSALSEDSKIVVDRIIAMKHVNEAYKSNGLKQQDDAYFQSLSPQDQKYIEVLSQTLKSPQSLSVAERAELNDALRYYQYKSSADQEKWDRLIARQVMTPSNGRFILPSGDMAFLSTLSSTQNESLSHLASYRSASQSIISGDFDEDMSEIQLLLSGISEERTAPQAQIVDLQFYNQLSPEEKVNVDLAIAMDYLNTVYQNPMIEEEDAQYFDRLSPTEKGHLMTMSANLKSADLTNSPQEQTRLKDALTYYVSLSPKVISRWDRLVAREALVKSGEQYILPSPYTDIRNELTGTEAQNLQRLAEYRRSNQMVISSPFDEDLRSIGISSATLAARVANEGYRSGNVENIRPVIEEEQGIEMLSTIDLNFYKELPKSQQKVIDRIIAVDYINDAYTNASLKRSDELFFKNLTPAEKTYIRLMVLDLKSERELTRAEISMVNEAFAFYSNLAPSVKSRWNRIVASETFAQDGNRFKLSASDAAFRQRLSPSAQASLSSIRDFRYSNERILSNNLEKESKDIAKSNVNFGVAKFNNTNFNYISVSGTLIKNSDGTPLREFPLLIVDGSGKTVAKTTTGRDGSFDFEDIPKGNYQVVAGRDIDSPGNGSPFFVKGLQVDGSSEGRFQYVIQTNIYFDFDSDKLRAEAEIALREIAQFYKSQQVYIELKSHTDDIGADNYNLNLSEKRNDAALNRLRAFGVRSDDIEWLAMGNKSPVAPNNSAYGRQFNRRIEISLKSNRPINYKPADVYLVRPQGTLFSIAKNFNVEVEMLRKANGLQGNNLRAYSPLRVPNPRNIKPNLDMLVELNESVASSKNTYTVKQGESIMSIAKKFNIPEELIIEMNDLKQTSLAPGQQLRIYVRDN